MSGFFGPELLELVDRQHRGLIFSHHELANQGIIEPRPGSLERQTPAELVDQY